MDNGTIFFSLGENFIGLIFTNLYTGNEITDKK